MTEFLTVKDDRAVRGTIRLEVVPNAGFQGSQDVGQNNKETAILFASPDDPRGLFTWPGRASLRTMRVSLVAEGIRDLIVPMKVILTASKSTCEHSLVGADFTGSGKIASALMQLRSDPDRSGLYVPPENIVRVDIIAVPPLFLPAAFYVVQLDGEVLKAIPNRL